MEKIFAAASIFLLGIASAQADVYVRGILRVPGSYRWAHNVPDVEVVREWWFGQNKMTFISTGWSYEYNPRWDWRFTLEKETNGLLAVNLSERWYVELALDADPLTLFDSGLAGYFKVFQMGGRVVNTGEKETILGRECEVFKVEEWVEAAKANRFYEIERTMRLTTDVPFPWRIFEELRRRLTALFNPDEALSKGWSGLEGFILAEDVLFFELAGKLSWSFAVEEISEKPAPAGIFDIPANFQKKEKITPGELFDMFGMLYPEPIY
jgi:hypothetical protein